MGRDRDGIERKKVQLKQCYAQAKDKGQKVNQHRLNINEVKASMQQCRIAAAVSSGEGGSETSQEERRLREKMEAEKEAYKATFDELKRVKGETGTTSGTESSVCPIKRPRRACAGFCLCFGF